MTNPIREAYELGRKSTRVDDNPYVPAVDDRTQFLARMWNAGRASMQPKDKLPDPTEKIEIPYGDTTDDDGIGRLLVERRRRGLPTP